MDKGEGILFRTTTKMERRNGFTHRVEGEPEPKSRSGRADVGVEFIHFHEREHKAAKEIVVHP